MNAFYFNIYVIILNDFLTLIYGMNLITDDAPSLILITFTFIFFYWIFISILMLIASSICTYKYMISFHMISFHI